MIGDEWGGSGERREKAQRIAALNKQKSTLRLQIEMNEEIEKRKLSWIRPEPKEKRGVLAKYAKLVSSASLGAITDAL